MGNKTLWKHQPMCGFAAKKTRESEQNRDVFSMLSACLTLRCSFRAPDVNLYGPVPCTALCYRAALKNSCVSRRAALTCSSFYLLLLLRTPNLQYALRLSLPYFSINTKCKKFLFGALVAASCTESEAWKPCCVKSLDLTLYPSIHTS